MNRILFGISFIFAMTAVAQAFAVHSHSGDGAASILLRIGFSGFLAIVVLVHSSRQAEPRHHQLYYL